MTQPGFGVEPAARTYRLYLPGAIKIVLLAVLGFFTLFGVAMVLGLFPDRESRIFGLVWILITVVFWYQVGTIPYRIDVMADGRVIFVSFVRRIQLSPQAIRSIKPQGNQLGMFILKHDGGRLRMVAQFDGFHEFLTNLKKANPGVELRGC
jgi:hypothetical protein